ncbi:MAG: hypothetical protein HOW73_23980 [Polyangiaceae bacterium]|nr:hypothetical protein [Polyangiaceae bacterium]
MRAHDLALGRVSRMLRSAARHLETVDPTAIIGDVVAASVTSPREVPEAVRPQFAESAPGALSLFLRPGGGGASPRDHVDTAVQAARRVVDEHLGREARRWLDGRVEAATAVDYRPGRQGGLFGSSFDRHGLAESVVGFELSSGYPNALAPSLQRLVRTVTSALPSLRPSFTMVRCGRSAGTQQVSFDIEASLALGDLKLLMDELGIGKQHGSLMSSTAFLLGARFTLPPGSASLTLRPIRGGTELRLDVILEKIPDPPPQLVSLLRLVMTERPRSLSTFERWLSAFTPEGFPTAGDFTILSVWVRPDVPARVALFLRPAALSTAEAAPHAPAPSVGASRIEPVSPWDPIA